MKGAMKIIGWVTIFMLGIVTIQVAIHLFFALSSGIFGLDEGVIAVVGIVAIFSLRGVYKALVSKKPA